MEQKRAPPTDPVFCLVSTAFDEQASDLQNDMGSPAVSLESFWGIYLEMLNSFQSMTIDLSHAFATMYEGEDSEISLLEGLNELQYGRNVIGSLEPEGFADP